MDEILAYLEALAMGCTLILNVLLDDQELLFQRFGEQIQEELR